MDFVGFRREFKAFKAQVGRLDTTLAQLGVLEKDRQANLVKLLAGVKKIRQLADLLREAPQWEKRLQSGFAVYEQELELEQQRLQKRFGSMLADELRSVDLELTGNLPDLECGYLTISPDFEADHVTIWFGPRQERLEKCRLRPAEVAQRVRRTREGLGSGLTPDQFQLLLRRAIERAGWGSGGTQQSLIGVLGELAFLLQKPSFRQDPTRERFRSYSRADFGFDLYRLQSPGTGPRFSDTFHLVGSTRAQTKSRSGFLWVPRSDSCRGVTYSEIQLKGAPV